MPWIPFSCVDLPEGREYCDECYGTCMRRSRWGGNISDDDFSECNACFGLGLKPLLLKKMTETQLDDFLKFKHYDNALKRCKTVEDKRNLVKGIYKLYEV